MLSNRDYAALGAGRNVYVFSEMDTEYNTRTVQVIPANPTNNTYSVAKAFTVAAIGMCVDRGLVRVEDRFLDIMGMELPEGCDEKWRDVTVHMLLKHQIGLGHGILDIDCENASEYTTDDYLSIVLKQPLPGKQGVDSCYSDGAFYMLSLVVEKVTGQRLVDFMRHPLMDVMRFGELAWSCCPKGHSMGATGLYIRCNDMVKLGVLYLNHGVWKGERILSEEWCNTVLERGYEFHEAQSAPGWYCKGGMCGQMLALNPSEGFAVGWMGHGDTGMADIFGR